MPQTLNIPANCLISLACGIQIQAITKMHGNVVSTTMCVGNLKTGTVSLCDYVITKNPEHKKKAALYFLTIFVFTIGAILGNFFVIRFGQTAILFSAVSLIIAFLLMFKENFSL